MNNSLPDSLEASGTSLEYSGHTVTGGKVMLSKLKKEKKKKERNREREKEKERENECLNVCVNETA